MTVESTSAEMMARITGPPGDGMNLRAAQSGLLVDGQEVFATRGSWSGGSPPLMTGYGSDETRNAP